MKSKTSGFKDVVLLGMGGSSLCPEVFAITFGQALGFPRLHVNDSTDPDQIRTLESKLDLAKTLFIVSANQAARWSQTSINNTSQIGFR